MSEAVFMKLAGPQLVQMYIGEGAKARRRAGGARCLTPFRRADSA